MSEPQIPQLTDLGERLAQDNDRKHLESLLERLSEQPSGAGGKNFAPLAPPADKQESESRLEALKSARHILQTVWSMQHMDKLTKDKLTKQP